MSVDWSTKVVLITGASSGIGHGLAVELARRGASLGLLSRRAENLREIAQEAEGAGGHALALAADVKDAGAVRAAADELRAHFGRVDVLVANAGIAPVAPAFKLQASEVAETFNVNVLGAVNSVAAVMPEMIAQGSGQLVAISSLAAYRGLANSSAYCASKAALSAFFESLRLDLHETGVDVTIIHPGFIKTPLTAHRRGPMPFLMELNDAIEKIVRAIEARKKSVAFPWPLASLARLSLVLPTSVYDRIALKNSFRR